MISLIWSESNPLESRTREMADPRVSVSARRGGSHVTCLKFGWVAGTRTGRGKTTAREWAKTARVRAATREDPKRRPLLFFFAPMRVPPRLPALAATAPVQRLSFGQIQCDPALILGV